MKIIAITSPATDAGKTFIASGLAETGTATGLKTLIIDFDSPIGDLIRVFGVATTKAYPTITSWMTYNQPWEYCLRSKEGTYVLPKSEKADELITSEDVTRLFEKANSDFDLVVCDLGSDFSTGYWTDLVANAALPLLVSDCDEKAVVRIQEFLGKIAVPDKKWILLVNNRESKGIYSARQITRLLGENPAIGKIIQIPHFKNIQKTFPKTFASNTDFALKLIDMAANNMETYQLNQQTMNIDNCCEEDPTQSFSPDENLKQETTHLTEDLQPLDLQDIPELEPASPFNPPTTEQPIIKKTQRLPISITDFWTRVKQKQAGIIVEGNYVKGNWENSVQMLDSLLPLDGVVIPREWGINAVKDIKRDPRSRTVPIIVLKGNKEWLAAGADKYVRKINSSVIKDTTALAKRLRELWQMEDTDSLTGLYSRKFFNIWLTEQTKQSKTFSLVMIDIDKFKNVNDTYGHPAGDTVLATFGSFLKSEVRNNDFVARYGGEEFIIGLPGLTAGQGHIIIDRLRERWSERVINVSDGRSIKSTFSAGVADSYSGSNILEAADQMLYKAKENGRNQVKTDTANSADKVLIMGQIPSARFVQCNIDITFDPQEAFATVCDVSNIRYAPADKILYVLGTNSVIDWAAKQSRPEAIICSSIEEIIKELTGEENLNNDKTVTVQESIKPVQVPDNKPENKVSVLPGARSTSEGQTIPVHGVLYVVCPSRPGQAGEMAAKLCTILKNAALVCAASESTAALSIGIPIEQLIISDWRIPGAEAPVKWAGTTVWPVDPYKHINILTVDAMHNLVDQIQSLFPLTIVDCGGSLDICSRVAPNEGVLVLYHQGDSADVATAHWIKTYGGRNVKVMSPSEVPDIIEADNGFVISHGAMGFIRNNS